MQLYPQSGWRCKCLNVARMWWLWCSPKWETDKLSSFYVLHFWICFLSCFIFFQNKQLSGWWIEIKISKCALRCNGIKIFQKIDTFLLDKYPYCYKTTIKLLEIMAKVYKPPVLIIIQSIISVTPWLTAVNPAYLLCEWRERF